MIDEKKRIIDVCCGSKMFWFNKENGEWIDFDGFVVDAAKVTAWQPLPEPWEEKKNEQMSKMRKTTCE